MSLLQLTGHFFNFVAPALGVGFLMALLAPLLVRPARLRFSRLRQGSLNTLAGAACLMLGLAYFGYDGKMATYLALVLACGTCQWFGMRFKG